MMKAEKLSWLAYVSAVFLIISPLPAYVLGFWDEYWRIITEFGDEPAYVALATILYVGVSRELGAATLLALITSAWVNVYLKNFLALPRPPRELWKVEASGYGFPSGHAQTSSAFWMAAGLKLRKTSVLALGAVLVTLVSVSRVTLGVHYVHDVVGGAALGFLVAWLTVWILRRSRFEGLRSAATLAVYGFLISLLYLAYPEPTFMKMGGVSLGFSAYPLAKKHLEYKASIPARIVVTAVVLIIAFLLTRFFDKQASILQFAGYTLTTLIIALSPAVYRVRGAARES